MTAHPDDESMFFIPTLLNLKHLGYRINILCMSNGNSKQREDELKKATEYLEIDNLTILDLSSKGIKDGMNENWSLSVLYDSLE